MNRLRANVPLALVHLYALRVQILGFLFLWPVAGWAFRSPLLWGLQDIGNREIGLVSQLAGAQAIFLAVTTNLVLLWGDRRFKGERRRVEHQRARLVHLRRAVSALSLVCWFGFMSDVRSGSEAAHFWPAAAANLVLVLVVVTFLEEVMNSGPHRPVKYRLFLLPLPGLWTDSFSWSRAVLNWLSRTDPFADEPNRGLPKLLGKTVPRSAWRVRRQLIRGADWLLGPGFLEYRGGRATRMLPGHLIALVWIVLLFWLFEDPGLQFQNSGAPGFRYRLIAPSPLSMALTAAFFLTSVLSFVAFYADRFRLPVSVILLALVAVAATFNKVDHVFWSEPVRQNILNDALTPRQTIELSPRKIIVVAAAGGGIQASGWTAQVLSGLREGERGPAFKRALRVISAVSGGAVGAVFYAGTYDGVWSKTAYSLDESRRLALSSSLDAVLWGLVYPDLHRLFLPIPRWLWQDQDRGWSLERSIAIKAGQSPGPRLLALAPLVKDGFPVLLLNATLTEQALPVTFTNSRYPGPQTTGAGLRNIRSFHEDFHLETRLETAARLSATFPIISPAARPSQLKGRDAFVDGGYFDNSGVYTLLGWLGEAASGMQQRRDVLLLLIDSFPEPTTTSETSPELRWYRQLTIPGETVLGVRTTGQAMRNRYEIPLLSASLKEHLTLQQLEFRYRPSKRCAEREPPLSWHLTRFEKECIAEAWNDPRLSDARRQVSDWLKDPE